MSAATVRRVTRSAKATHALGARLGRLLVPGDVVALVGELGAGKTQLVRGACSGAGVRPEEVSSPSFAIVATYAGRLPVHHADLYRIGDEDELYATGFGDLVGGEGALLVEWADRIPSALPAEKLTIRLSHDPTRPDVRHLEIRGQRPAARGAGAEAGAGVRVEGQVQGPRPAGPGPRPGPGPAPDAPPGRSFRGLVRHSGEETTPMRLVALLSLALPVLSLAAPAVKTPSRIDAVTVYRTGARVSRTARVELRPARRGSSSRASRTSSTTTRSGSRGRGPRRPASSA